MTREEMKNGYILTKARVKHSDASDSPDGDSEPENPEVKPEPAASSDESDIEARVARKKRVAKIVESDESDDGAPKPMGWIRKPRVKNGTATYGFLAKILFLDENFVS